MPDDVPAKCEAHSVQLENHSVRLNAIDQPDGRLAGLDAHLSSLERRMQEGDNALSEKIQKLVDSMNTIGNKAWLKTGSALMEIVILLIVAWLSFKIGGSR